jgi:hypothetical protein
MLEFYHKGRNMILDCIDSAKTNITKNERKRLQKRIETLLWEVSKDSFGAGYDACKFAQEFNKERESK